MNRLGCYIDALRGIGIILLVYNHFLFFGFSGGMSTMTPLDNEVMFILMPLFLLSVDL
jgi:fucose 4-O-acetylase-like acetyltransferase